MSCMGRYVRTLEHPRRERDWRPFKIRVNVSRAARTVSVNLVSAKLDDYVTYSCTVSVGAAREITLESPHNADNNSKLLSAALLL